MATPQPDQITLDEFQDALGRYDQLLEAVSTSKGGMSLRKSKAKRPSWQIKYANELIAKSGQKTLAELDAYRYVKAPARFAATSKAGGSSRNHTMQLQDVKTLVEWKL